MRDQIRDGVTAEVIFPTFALQACFASDDPRLQAQLCRAYNGWAGEVFAGRPSLLAVGAVPLVDIDDGIAEARRLADAGFRALMLPARVLSRPYNDAEYDRFWVVAEELGLPLTFHSGTGYEPRLVRGPGGAVVNYVMGAQLDGPMVILSLAAGGALDRFPGLRVVTVETGASWLAWIMTQADAIYRDHAMYAKPKLSMLPSELIRRQCAATFMYDPVAIHNRHITGLDTLMWGNDYPHPEGTWPESQATNARPVRRGPRRRDRRDRRVPTRRGCSASTSDDGDDARNRRARARGVPRRVVLGPRGPATSGPRACPRSPSTCPGTVPTRRRPVTSTRTPTRCGRCSRGSTGPWWSSGTRTAAR